MVKVNLDWCNRTLVADFPWVPSMLSYTSTGTPSK